MGSSCRLIVLRAIIAFDVNREVVWTSYRCLFNVYMQWTVFVNRYGHLLIFVTRHLAVFPFRFGERDRGVKFRSLLVAIQIISADLIRFQFGRNRSDVINRRDHARERPARDRISLDYVCINLHRNAVANRWAEVIS